MLIYLIVLGILVLMMSRDINKAFLYERPVSSSILKFSNILKLVFILASVLANIHIGAKILLISYFISFRWILNAYYSDADIQLYGFIAYVAAVILLFFSSVIGIVTLSL